MVDKEKSEDAKGVITLLNLRMADNEMTYRKWKEDKTNNTPPIIIQECQCSDILLKKQNQIQSLNLKEMMHFNSRCFMKGRDYLPFPRSGGHRQCLMGSVLLFLSCMCCVLFCVLLTFVLCLVCNMLPVSLDNPFLIASSIFS